jgi:ABC-2 type transport system ATP-binding protein
VAFYDALLADYLAHPRTVVLSSHLIDEVDRLIEDVVVLDRGTVLLAQEAEDLRTTALTVSGPVATVDAFAADRRVLARQQLGGTAQVTLHGASAADAARAQALGLAPGPVPLQDLIVHLTSEVAS